MKSRHMGMTQTPTADTKLRSRLEKQWAGKDDDSLRDAVRIIDPVSAERIGKRDRYRLLRALEVHAQTGQPLSGFNLPSEVRKDYQVLSIGLSRDRKELYERINERVDSMMEQGLSTELATLRENGAKRSDPGMKAIGYREWFGENGEKDPDADRVRVLIARNTRRYAKRQITFFSTLPNVRWFDAGDEPRTPGGLEDTVNAFLGYGVSSRSLDQDAPVGDNP
jgi:tRNA dimethylallyltransferase